MLYAKNFELQSVNYLDWGICGRFEFSSSSFSRTDCVSRNSSREMATIAILQIINKAATIDKHHGKFTYICQYRFSNYLSNNNFVTKIRRWCPRFRCFTR